MPLPVQAPPFCILIFLPVVPFHCICRRKHRPPSAGRSRGTAERHCSSGVQGAASGQQPKLRHLLHVERGLTSSWRSILQQRTTQGSLYRMCHGSRTCLRKVRVNRQRCQCSQWQHCWLLLKPVKELFHPSSCRWSCADHGYRFGIR